MPIRKQLKTRLPPPKTNRKKGGGGGGQAHQRFRLRACRNLKVIFGCLIMIWLIYVIGIVIMAVGVHKDNMYNDNHNNIPKDASTATIDHHEKRHIEQEQRLSKHLKISPHDLVASSKNKNQMVHVSGGQQPSSNIVVMNNNSTSSNTVHKYKNPAPLSAALDQHDKDMESNEPFNPLGLYLEAKSKGKVDLTLPKPKMKRPNWKASPFGHLVNPDLSHTNEQSQQQQQRHEEDNARAVPDDQILTAYLEDIDRLSWWDVTPLPVRATAQSDKLQKRKYARLNSCSKLPEQWPVDEYADADPFLPWIHDVFPTEDGKYIQFVAQNKRRCHTGTTDMEEAWLFHTAPQASLFEHVPLKKIDGSNEEPRYRLASHDDADPESMATRFLCRFKPSEEITFSEFNNDYEWVAFRKSQSKMFSPDGRDNHQIQTSQLIFKCPVPESLQETVREGNSVVDDWATLFLDLIPIRTPPRIGPPDEFLVPRYRDSANKDRFHGRGKSSGSSGFDPDKAWGKDHVLPTIENSGRWENIPICKPSLQTYEQEVLEEHEGDSPNVHRGSLITVANETKHYNHHLVSCLWASAGYATRGNRYAINDGQRRLTEWISFNKLLGFDHFYIYDNSGAYSNEFSLASIAEVFPGDITIVNWPSRVCNNNPNNVDSPGERSSQYAAETSCRLRFGPHVKWIGQFDIDEYLVPMGKYTSVLPLLEKLEKENNHIISFASWRAWPRYNYINEPVRIKDKELCGHKEPCFELSVPKNTTLLEAYNCDRQKPGEKKHQMPAEKQIYRADYVQQHFIHYSTVTSTTNLLLDDYTKQFGYKRPFPDPLSRFVDEVNEGLMLHSKAIARQDTAGWEKNCRHNTKGIDQCRIGYPYPKGANETEITHTSDGWDYNCYAHEKIDSYWGPRLQEKMQELGLLKD